MVVMEGCDVGFWEGGQGRDVGGGLEGAEDVFGEGNGVQLGLCQQWREIDGGLLAEFGRFAPARRFGPRKNLTLRITLRLNWNLVLMGLCSSLLASRRITLSKSTKTLISESTFLPHDFKAEVAVQGSATEHPAL